MFVFMIESGVRSSCAMLPMNCFCDASAVRAGERANRATRNPNPAAMNAMRRDMPSISRVRTASSWFEMDAAVSGVEVEVSAVAMAAETPPMTSW